jgi:hypothetical protein
MGARKGAHGGAEGRPRNAEPWANTARTGVGHETAARGSGACGGARTSCNWSIVNMVPVGLAVQEGRGRACVCVPGRREVCAARAANVRRAAPPAQTLDGSAPHPLTRNGRHSPSTRLHTCHTRCHPCGRSRHCVDTALRRGGAVHAARGAQHAARWRPRPREAATQPAGPRRRPCARLSWQASNQSADVAWGHWEHRAQAAARRPHPLRLLRRPPAARPPSSRPSCSSWAWWLRTAFATCGPQSSCWLPSYACVHAVVAWMEAPPPPSSVNLSRPFAPSHAPHTHGADAAHLPRRWGSPALLPHHQAPVLLRQRARQRHPHERLHGRPPGGGHARCRRDGHA